LKLPNFAALPVDLGSHALDVGAELIKVWHGRSWSWPILG
jgi:hypothetical protein